MQFWTVLSGGEEGNYNIRNDTDIRNDQYQKLYTNVLKHMVFVTISSTFCEMVTKTRSNMGLLS